ncbi:Hypoxanthine phosphoribosyltransferase/Xanthine phosphoribosyltransferase [Xylaria longipes]|nr:Hypoxanthine phosphoribosyltransferase/Xanthine phosphoribosyltransferase [Xylaria longipes]
MYQDGFLVYVVESLALDLHTSYYIPSNTSDIKTDGSCSNKDKQKKGVLPADAIDDSRYIAARTVGDVWICYPWEAIDIDEHDRLAAEQRNKTAAA